MELTELEQLHEYRHLCVERLGRIAVQRTLLEKAYLNNITQLLELNQKIRELNGGQ